jgi:hypothetical protein
VPLLTLPTIATRSDRQMPPDFSDEPLSTVSAAAPADTAGSVRRTGSGAGSHVYSGPARQPRPLGIHLEERLDYRLPRFAPPDGNRPGYRSGPSDHRASMAVAVGIGMVCVMRISREATPRTG